MASNNLGTAEGEIVINSNSLGTVQANLRQTGALFGAFGGALVGGFGAAVNASADFEQQISIVKAVSGETGAELDRLRDKALDLGRKGPFGPTEIASAFAELSKAGITATEIIDGAGESVINLAKAGDLKVPQAAEILANTMRTFNIEAKDTNKVIDLLAGAANQSTLEVDDLAVSLKYAGGIASGLGIPIEDVSTALAQLGNAGIKGSTGGTSLRQMLLQLDPVSKNARKELKELGIITSDGANQFFTAEGKAKSLREIFEILKTSTSGLTDQERIHSLGIIFGNRAAASAAILSREGAAGYDEMSEAIGKVSAADVAADKLDNLNGSIRKMKAALETTLIGAGSPFQNTLQGIVDGITKLVLWFDKLPGPVKTFILGGMAIVGVLSLMAGAVFLTLAPIVSMVNTFSKLPGTLSTISKGFKLISGTFAKMGAALVANPIFLIIAAIIVLAVALYYLYTHNEKFREFVDNLWQTIQKVWDKILGFFKKLPEYFGEAFEWVKEKFSAFVNWIKQNWDILLAIFTGPLGLIVLIWRRFGDTIVEKAGEAVATVIEFFQRLPGRVGGFIQDMVSTALDFLTALPEQIGEAFNRVASAIANFLIRLPYQLGYALGALIGLSIQFVVQFVQFWVNLGADVLTAIGNFVLAIPGFFTNLFTTVISAVVNFVTSMVLLAVDLGQRFLAAIINFFTQLPGRLQEAFATAWSWTVNFVTSMVLLAVDLGQRFIAAVVNFFTQLPGAILGLLNSAGSTIKGFATEAIRTMFGMGYTILMNVISFFSSLPKAMIDAMGDLGKILWNAGVEIMKGFINGLKSMAGGVKDFFGGLTKGITSWKGPESTDKKLLRPAGRWILGGFVDELEKQEPMVQGFFNSLTSSIGSFSSSMAPTSMGTGTLTNSLPAGLASGVSERAQAAPAESAIHVQNHFTGDFMVRDDRDALNISRFLAEETRRTLRAKGEQFVTVRT